MPVDPEKPNPTNEITRRKFIAVAAGTASAMLIKPNLVRGTAANSAVRLGLLGCGGRGTEDEAILWTRATLAWWRLATCSKTN